MRCAANLILHRMTALLHRWRVRRFFCFTKPQRTRTLSSSSPWREYRHQPGKVGDCRDDGEHPGDSSRSSEKLADTKLCPPSTPGLDASFCTGMADCFDNPGMGALLPAGKTSGWTFWIRRCVYAHRLGMCGPTWRQCMDLMLILVCSCVRWRSLLALGTQRHI